MKYLLSVVFVFIALNVFGGDSARILGIFPTASKSHFAVGSSILKTLAENGHDITMIACFPMPKSANITYTEIDLSGLIQEFQSRVPPKIMEQKRTPFTSIIMLRFFGPMLVEYTFENEQVQRLLKEKPQFDLIISESFGTEAFYGLAEYFGAPLVVVSSTTSFMWINDLSGNPEPWSYVPNAFLSYTSNMSFPERFMNTIINGFQLITQEWYHYGKQDQMMKKYLPSVKKPLRQIMKEDVSLVFLNTHYSLSLPRPYVPNMIEIGGINIDRTMGKLPTDIQQFLDSATDGAILFSMGSFLKASDLNPDQRKAFIDTFAKLKQKVIWRYNLDDADTLPKNILVKEWLPQKEIMGHRNVKLFITHGGMLGTTEAVYHGLPMIGIPVFGDQLLNIARAEMRGYALKLNIKNVTESDITKAIKEMITNTKYSENAKQLSKIYRDQPMTPQENVIYWSEYVINHKGAPHLRVEGLNLGFIEYHNLDVFLVLIIGFVVLIVLPQILCCRFIFRKMFSKPSKSKVKTN